MHGLLDLGFESTNTAFLAQQAIEHAMKALISALGEEYHPHHPTRHLALHIRRLDPSHKWRFASNLGQLDNFAGGGRYDTALTPIQDFREMANNVTDDLDLIYQRIQAITGEDPWSKPAEGTTDVIQPRWRPSPDGQNFRPQSMPARPAPTASDSSMPELAEPPGHPGDTRHHWSTHTGQPSHNSNFDPTATPIYNISNQGIPPRPRGYTPNKGCHLQY